MQYSQFEMHVTVRHFSASDASAVYSIPLLQSTGCCIAGSSSGAGPVVVGGATLFAVIVTSVAFLPC